MAFYPAQLQSANLEQFGIVYADEVQGHKTVANLEALYDVSDAILSKSTTNAGNDALGQQWYVVSEGCYYRLDNWANRNQASGWRKMQNVDEEFDSLQEHGADKIKSFTTTSDTVSLNYNTWKNSTTSVDGSVTIPAATGDQAGVLTANGKDQLTQLNKLGEVTHLTDGGVFTEEASTVTVHYKCINTKEGATSAVVTKSEAIPEATLTKAGVLSAAKRNQLEQLDKIGEVTHLTDSGVFTTDANTVTLHYQCVDTNSGANSAVSTKTAVIPEATLTKAGTLAASNRNQLEQLNKITAVSHIADEQAFTSNANNVALNFKCILTTDGAAEDLQEHSVNIPAASNTSAGTMSATDKIEHDRINTANFALGAVTPSTTAVAIAASKTNITNGSSVANNITIPGVTESAAGVMSAADKAKLNDITIPEGGVDFSGDATDVINGAGDSVDLMAKFPTTVVTNLTGVTPSTSAATINFTRSAKDTLDYNAATSNTVTIPGATTSAAGLMSATDKTEHDRITTTNFTLGAVTPSASTVQIAATKTTISTGASAANNITLPAVTESAAGVMSAADKVKLDTTIPNYTVNGMRISTNPVLDGADIRLTGYSKPSSTSGIAATDTINAALGKLETGLSNEITNRTKADSNLQSQITNLNNGKVSSVTKSGTGAVITGGSISGSTLTLTSGNFTFANGSSGNFTVTPPGGAAQTVSIGKPATAGTADVAKSVAWGNVSGKVNASTSTNGLMTTAQVTKLNGIAAGAEVNQNAFSNVVVGGTTIAADAKTDTLTLIAGSNVTLTPNATNDSVTIASSYVNTTYAAGSNLTLSGTTFALASTISLTRVNASSGFFQQSDKRLKSDIKPLEHTIEDICSIPTDSFILNGKQDLGTIAQDLEEKFPEVVSECELKAAEIPNPEDFEKVEKDGETYVLVKEVDYAKLSILALEGIKLLKKEIDELKKELHK